MINSQQLLAMDSHILLSLVNMKLRNEFSSFDILCRSLRLDKAQIETKLGQLNYQYQPDLNQFR